MNRLHLILLASLLLLGGTALFLYKVLALHFPLDPDTEDFIWSVEAQISFQARDRPVKVAVYIPQDTPHFSVVNENFISRSYGLVTKKVSGNRQAVWSTRRTRGKQTLYYHTVVRGIEKKSDRENLKPPQIDKPGFEGPYLQAAETVIAEIGTHSADIDSFVSELIKRLNRTPPDENAALLLGKQPTPPARIQAAVKVLAQSGIAARPVNGIQLAQEQRDAVLTTWLEVYDLGRWRSYDPVTGVEGVPESYLAWWRGFDPLVNLTGGRDLKTKISISLNREEAIQSAIERTRLKNPALLEFSLLRLPIQTQSVYRILLLIPLGSLVVVLFRNVVGLNTFGTFMPILIALAFRETELLWGIVMFCLMVALGLTFRFYLDRLKLLLVPRLASVLTMVIILMVLVSVVMHKLGLEQGVSIALFPMVILTMTIERMSIVWEELGALAALSQALGSLLVAALTYLMFNNRYVAHMVFYFPELLLLVLAVTLLLGRYTGYRLFEIRRFKDLSKARTGGS